MEKEYMINYINGQMNVLESLKNITSDDVSKSVIQAKIDTLNDILEVIKKAPVPFELI